MDRRARMEYDGNMTFSMTIHNIRKEDRGEFSCIANNNLGKETGKRAVLKVNCKFLIKLKMIQEIRSNSHMK